MRFFKHIGLQPAWDMRAGACHFSGVLKPSSAALGFRLGRLRRARSCVRRSGWGRRSNRRRGSLPDAESWRESTGLDRLPGLPVTPPCWGSGRRPHLSGKLRTARRLALAPELGHQTDFSDSALTTIEPSDHPTLRRYSLTFCRTGSSSFFARFGRKTPCLENKTARCWHRNRTIDMLVQLARTIG
jgi:hypothetical protein